MPNHAPRRSRKAGKMGTGAERRRQRRLEEEAVRHLQSISDLTEDAFLYRLQRSREGRVISVDLEDRINIYGIPNSIGQLKALAAWRALHVQRGDSCFLRKVMRLLCELRSSCRCLGHIRWRPARRLGSCGCHRHNLRWRCPL